MTGRDCAAFRHSRCNPATCKKAYACVIQHPELRDKTTPPGTCEADYMEEP